MDISIVIPTYNEEVLIGDTLKETVAFLETNFLEYEVIVVDDGSWDDTRHIVMGFIENNPKVHFLRSEKNKGKGCSVRKGLIQSNGEFVFFMDADLSTPLDEIIRMIEIMKKNKADIGIGSRALPSSDIIKSQKFLRMFMGKIFNFFLQMVVMRGIKDTQCGFKCFRKRVIKQIFSKTKIDGFCFDAEVLLIAKKQKLLIIELPVKWINREDSRVNIVQGSISMFVDLFRIRLNSFLGKYK